jgi:UDP-glucuronate decarboxylase
MRHDITWPLHVEGDWIFNLACCASPQHYQRDPEKTVRTCTSGAANVLREARRTGARAFQASTSEVYGEPEMHPQRESYRGAVNPTGPRACYDEGKRCAEALFFDYHRLHGVEIKVARIFNTYGPQMQLDDGRVVSNFIVQALRNQPLTIHGDGSQTRSFCYVDDLIDGFMKFMASPPDVTGPINLGNPVEVTMLELARRIVAITGSRSRIEHRPMPVDDPTRRCPDIGLAQATLDWSPRVSLDEGLRRTIAWFERVLGADAADQVLPERSSARA